MDNKTVLEILDEINSIPLVTSREELFLPALQRKLQSWLPSHTIHSVDANLLVVPPHPCQTVLLAHIDEIGFLAKRQLSPTCYELSPAGLVNQQAAHGSLIQTIRRGRTIPGIIGNVLPHSQSTVQRLIAEFSEPVHLPPLWPVQFRNIVLAPQKKETLSTSTMSENKSGGPIFSKTLDNRLGCACLIAAAQHSPLAFLLTTGEEEGTQRLQRPLEHIVSTLHPTRLLVIDSGTASSDPYLKSGIPPGHLGLVPVEGGGSGSRAPPDLVRQVEQLLTSLSIPFVHEETHHPDEITDATCLSRLGHSALAVCYPVRYLHNAVEAADFSTIQLLLRFLEGLSHRNL